MHINLESYYNLLDTFPGSGVKSVFTPRSSLSSKNDECTTIVDYYGNDQYVIEDYYKPEPVFYRKLNIEEEVQQDSTPSQFLPTDSSFSQILFRQVQEEASNVKLAQTSLKNMILGVACLGLGFISTTLKLPLMLSLSPESIFSKISWHLQGSAVMAAVTLALFLYFRRNSINARAQFQVDDVQNNLASACLLLCSFAGVALAAQLGGILPAYAFWNSSGVILFAYKTMMSNNLTRQNAHPTFAFASGIALIIVGILTKYGFDLEQLGAAILAMMAAACAAVFIVLNSTPRSEQHPVSTGCQILILAGIMQFFAFSSLAGPQEFLSFNSKNGAFGWLTSGATTFQLIVCNGGTTVFAMVLGYCSLHYWSGNVVGGIMLTAPFISQLWILYLQTPANLNAFSILGSAVLVLSHYFAFRARMDPHTFDESKRSSLASTDDEECGYVRLS